MESLFVLAAVAVVVGVRIWANVALSQFIADLPADQRVHWRRALRSAD